MGYAAFRTIAIFMGAIAAAGPVAAQQTETGPTANLAQITLVVPATASATEKDASRKVFEAAAQRIRACAEVADIAAEIGAEYVARDKVPLRSLPPELQPQVRELGAGGVTRIFGDDSTFRVLIRCDG
jgi:hypothetical protein